MRTWVKYLKRQFRLVISGAIISFLLLAKTAFPQEEAATIEIRTIGIPPYGIEDSNPPSGIYYDIANLLADEAGYLANNHIYPYARIVNELKSGQTDMTIMFKYEELEEYVTYIASLPTLRTVVIGNLGTTFSSIEDLKGKTLAYLRGATFSDEIDNDPEIIKLVTNDFNQGIRMLRLGRVDGIIGPLEPILNAAEGSGILGEPFVVDERTPWVQISKAGAAHLSADRLNSIFLDIQNRGDLDIIRNQYNIQGE